MASQSERATTYTRSLDVAHLDCIQHYVSRRRKWRATRMVWIWCALGIAHVMESWENRQAALIITRSSFLVELKLSEVRNYASSISWWQLKLRIAYIKVLDKPFSHANDSMAYNWCSMSNLSLFSKNFFIVNWIFYWR